MTALPPSSDFSTVPGNHGNMRASLVAVQGFLAGLLGSDGTVATALATLGSLGAVYVAKTAAYSVVAADRGKAFDATTGTWTLSLLAVASAGNGFSVILRNSGTGTITVDPSGAEQVDGAATIIVAPGRAVLLICTGTAWVAHWMVAAAFTSTAPGLAPLSGGGTTNFLRADGTWAAPAGGGGGGGPTFLDGVFRVQNTADSTKEIKFDASLIPTGTTRTYFMPDLFNGTVIVDIGAQTISGTKTFTDTKLLVANLADATKLVRFDASLLTTGVTRTFSLPDVAGAPILITNLGAQTISGAKTFTDAAVQDNNFAIFDNLDATKIVKFQVASVTTGTTRTLTVPDATDTIAVLAAAQTLSNKTLGNTNIATLKDTSFTLQDDGDATKQAQFQLSAITTGATRVYTLPDATGTLVLQATTLAGYGITDAVPNTGTKTIAGQTTFTGNAIFADATFFLQDDGDATKQAKFQLSGITTGTTRTLTVPDFNGTFILDAGAQTISGAKTFTSATFQDNNFGIFDNLDNTKIVAFQLSGLTTATTRTLTVPDANGTLALNTVFTSGAAGLVPASGGGTVNFLRADGTFAAPPAGSGSPGGATTQMQYNSAGAFAGASEILVEANQLRLPTAGAVAAPASGGAKLIGRTAAGRTVPAFLSQDAVVRDVQTGLGRDSPVIWKGQAGGTGLTTMGGVGPTAVGTATAAAIATTNLATYTAGLEYLVTVAATTAVAGFRGVNTLVSVGGPSAALGGFHFIGKWTPATGVATTTNRAFFGLANTTAVPTDVEPSTSVSCIAMGWDAADTNIQIMSNDAAGTCTKVDLGASFPVPTVDRTALYQLELYSPIGTTQSVSWTVTDLVSGAVASGTISVAADMPSTTTLLAPRGWMSVGGTSSVIGLKLVSVYLDPIV